MRELTKIERRRRWLWGLAATLLIGLVAEVMIIGSFGTERSSTVLLPTATYGLVLAGLMVLVLLFLVYASQSLRALASEEAESQRLATREAVMQERLSGISDLLDITAQLVQKPNLRDTLSVAVDRALPCFDADYAALFLFIPGTAQLELLVSVGTGADFENVTVVRPGHGLVGAAYTSGDAQLATTPEMCAQLAHELGVESPPRSGLCVPISFDDAALGAFCLLRRSSGEPFSGVHAQALLSLGRHCGAAIFRSLHERRIASERGEVQAALLDSEKRYRRFFEHNIAGTYISGPDGRILDCNIAFAHLLGLSSVEEARAVELAALYPDAQLRAALMEELRTRRSVDRREQVMRRADGEAIQLMETVVGVFGPQGELLEIHGYVIDDTERRRTRERLRLAQRMEAIGRLTGGIAHTFNNMLTAILGNADMIQAHVNAEDPVDGLAETIKSAAARTAALTRQLLAYSRQQVLQPRILDLSELIGDTEDILRQALGPTIELTRSTPHELGKVKADPGQLQQILLNLALNARDAMPTGGKLTIRTADVELDDAYARERSWPVEPGPYVMLEVTDTGCGMNAETQARAFEPFFTTKEGAQASGLGLSAVYGIVKQSGGHIDLRSEPAHGTTVTVYLPRAEAIHVAVQGPPRRLGQGGETVLVVDDEDLVRAVIRTTLTAAGYRVLDARSAGDAVVQATGHDAPIDLLLTDLVMPGRGGTELVDRLTRQFPDLAILLMSGYVMPSRGARRGPVADLPFLQKPFTPGALLRKVRETLDGPRRQAA